MALERATAWMNVAKIVKPQGIKGEVVVVPIHGLPFVLQEGLEVVLTPPELRTPRARRIERIRELNGGWGVRFAGVSSLNDATQLAGKLVLAARADVEDAISEEELFDVVGLEVEDETYGALGSIVDTFETAAHDIWVVEGPYGEVLIPAVEEFVVAFPEDEGEPLRVDLPAGLVELNAPKPQEQEDGEE